jgi:diguanylate cyclase (GGDEF)-like protein
MRKLKHLTACLLCFASCVFCLVAYSASPSQNVEHQQNSAYQSLNAKVTAAEKLNETDPTQALADSEALFIELETTPYDDLRTRVIVLMARINSIIGDGDKAKHFAELGLSQKELTNDQKSHLYTVTSWGKLSNREDVKARNLAEDAYDFAILTGNKDRILEQLILRALMYAYTSEIDLALNDVLEAYEQIPELTDLQKKADLLDTISRVYAIAGNSDKSLSYALEALEEIKKTDNHQQISTFHSALAQSYELLKDWENAHKHFLESYNIAVKIKDEYGQYYSMYGVGRVQSKLGNHEAAVGRLQRVVQFFDKQNDPSTHFYTRWDLGIAARDGGNLDLAIEVLEQAREIAAKNKETMAADYTSATGSLARALHKKGMDKEAFEYILEFVEDRKKQIKVQDIAVINDARVKLNTELTDKENELLTKENLINQRQLQQERSRNERYMIFAVISIGLIVTLLILLKRNLNMRRKLEKIAITDELTQISNRRHIMQQFEQEFVRARRYNSPLCIALFDIDHFKKLNDEHGHAAGDKVLQIIAQICNDATRQQDELGRYGGEEFMLVFPHSEFEDTLKVCNRLLKTISNISFGDLYPGKITVSLGITELLQTDNKPFELLKRADEALYQAKMQGRNQVCSA